MGRGRHEHCWTHVTKVENGHKWICDYCKVKFSGGASRIEAHLGGKGGGIRRCSIYPGNQGVYNNLASTSSNPPEAVINTIYSTRHQVHEDKNVQAKVSDEENKKDTAEVIDEDSEEEEEEEDTEAQDDDMDVAEHQNVQIEDSKEETELTAFKNVQIEDFKEENKKDTAEVIVEDSEEEKEEEENIEAQDDDMDIAEHQNVQIEDSKEETELTAFENEDSKDQNVHIEDSKEETELTAFENVQNVEPQHVHVEEVTPNNDDISFSGARFDINIEDKSCKTALKKCLDDIENLLGLNVEEVTPNNNDISIAQFDLNIEDTSTSFGTDLENFLSLSLGNAHVLNVEKVTPNNNDNSIAQFDLNIEDKSTDYDVDNYLCLSLGNGHVMNEEEQFSSADANPVVSGSLQSDQIQQLVDMTQMKATSDFNAGSIAVSSNFFIPPPRGRLFFEENMRESSTSKLPNICGFSRSLGTFVTNDGAPEMEKDEVIIPVLPRAEAEPFVAELSKAKKGFLKGLKNAQKAHAKWTETTSHSSDGSISVSSNFFIPPPKRRRFIEASVPESSTSKLPNISGFSQSLDTFVTNDSAPEMEKDEVLPLPRAEPFVAETSRSKKIALKALKTAKKTHKLTCILAKWIQANAPALGMDPPIFDDPTLFDP